MHSTANEKELISIKMWKKHHRRIVPRWGKLSKYSCSASLGSGYF
jgi:hypothetical protein